MGINKLLLLFLFFFIVLVKPAHAYLDPGSGSFIFQIIVGTVLGSLFAIKTYFQKIKHFIFSLLGRKDEKNK